jgi:hypothetical protein
VKDSEQHGGPRGLDRSGVSEEGIARSSTEPQVVLDTAEPPHGVGVGCEVVRGESLGRDRVEERRGGAPVLCRVGVPRLGQAVHALVHPLSSID